MEPNELINFLDPKFVPSIKCSCPEDDLYTASNLISTDQRKFQLGFMAYRVVKPPIELHFSLKCRIELSSIKMWTQIDSLKSTGFEVHANSSDVSREYEKIGSFFNLKENCLQFVSTALEYQRDGNCMAAQFYRSTRNHLRKVKNIKIFIKQTNRSCVPVLKRIEIWGKVSQLETQEQHKQIQQIISNEAGKDSVQLTNEVSKEENTHDESHAIDESANNQLEIPEMFLDEITYEIMALPMILPSGKVIDNSSLMKHNEQEVKWGRLPSDPFTGQMFTDARKPILDVRLKSQIDTFLLQNCDNLAVRGVPRTVGSTKKREIAAVATNRVRRIEEITPHSSTDMKRARLDASPVQDASNAMQIKSVCSNNAVCNVLVTRKYTKINTKSSNSVNNCFQCQMRHEPDSNSLYIIQMCSHLICRSCLVDGNVKLCKCGREFDNFNIKKYHIAREI